MYVSPDGNYVAIETIVNLGTTGGNRYVTIYFNKNNNLEILKIVRIDGSWKDTYNIKWFHKELIEINGEQINILES